MMERQAVHLGLIAYWEGEAPVAVARLHVCPLHRCKALQRELGHWNGSDFPAHNL